MISKVNNILVVSFLALAVFTINSYATRELKAQAASEALYCYNCNENLKACSYPYNYTALENYSVPCNGFCVKFQNRFDENKWYRGCSWDLDLTELKPAEIQETRFQYKKNNVTYYVCDNKNGCNAD